MGGRQELRPLSADIPTSDWYQQTTCLVEGRNSQMSKIFFKHDVDTAGVTLRLIEKPLLQSANALPVDLWVDRMGNRAFSGISRVLALLDDPDFKAEKKDDGIFVDHHAVASLTEPEALSLGFSPAVQDALQVGTKNLITDPAFQISGQWIGDANRRLHANRVGAFLTIDGIQYRIPEPLFSLVEAIDAFANSETSNGDVRMAQLARLQALIPQEALEKLKLDSYFSSFRVLHATAFSLHLKTDGNNFDFDPVLFGRRVVEHSKAQDEPISEAEALLTEHQQDVFASNRFRSSETAKSSYVIETGVFVHLDTSLREAMGVVRRMQSADLKERKQFARAPQLFLKETLAGILSDEDVERLFVETEQYSARVIDLGIWIPPVLPWIKRNPKDWLPEKFGLQIGDQYLVLKADDLPELREQISEAIKTGESHINFGDEKI